MSETGVVVHVPLNERTLMDTILTLMQQGKVAWDRTLVARPEDEGRVYQAASKATEATNTHWRILSSLACPEGTILIINDEEIDKIVIGMDLAVTARRDTAHADEWGRWWGRWVIDQAVSMRATTPLDPKGILKISGI